jgi:hypothetical protein
MLYSNWKRHQRSPVAKPACFPVTVRELVFGLSYSHIVNAAFRIPIHRK